MVPREQLIDVDRGNAVLVGGFALRVSLRRRRIEVEVKFFWLVRGLSRLGRGLLRLAIALLVRVSVLVVSSVDGKLLKATRQAGVENAARVATLASAPLLTLLLLLFACLFRFLVGVAVSVAAEALVDLRKLLLVGFLLWAMRTLALTPIPHLPCTR